MTTPRFLSAALIATSMLATPAMARTAQLTARHFEKNAHASASPAARYVEGRFGTLAPLVGIPAPPPDGENCDVGDNPRIC
jgi:hypothetical protein